MKKTQLLALCALFTFFFSRQVLATATDEGAAQVLQNIDEVCGDDWCEGPYSFSFQAVEFFPEAKETRVTFEIGLDAQISATGETIVYPSYVVSCTIADYASAEEIISYKHFLVPGFRASLDACIDDFALQLSDLEV